MEFEVNTAHHVVVIHQAADALSRQKTKSADRTPIDNEAPVHSILPKSLVCAPSPIGPELETIEELQDPSVPLFG